MIQTFVLIILLFGILIKVISMPPIQLHGNSGTFIYPVFFRFKLLPWNRVTQFITLVDGVVFATGFFIGLENLNPKSKQGVIVGRTVDTAPLVSGLVTAPSGSFLRDRICQLQPRR